MYKYIADENKIHLHSLRNRLEKAYLKLAFLPVESFNNQIYIYSIFILQLCDFEY
jgi:hypothetical protein